MLYAGFFLTISHDDIVPGQRYLIPIFSIYVFYLVKGLEVNVQSQIR